jgi:hypothetical protein
MARSLLVSPLELSDVPGRTMRAKKERAITFLEVMALCLSSLFAVRLATSPRARRQVNADDGKEEAKAQTEEHGERPLCHNDRWLGIGDLGLAGLVDRDHRSVFTPP